MGGEKGKEGRDRDGWCKIGEEVKKPSYDSGGVRMKRREMERLLSYMH